MEKVDPSNAFPETRWSIVLDACDGKDRKRAERALNEVCGTYWLPLYVYARGRGYPQTDAEDLTQAFFVRLLAGDILRQADAGMGKLRSYLLTCFDNHIYNVNRANSALKRGGTAITISITDIEALEGDIALHQHPDMSPDELYDRQCAVAMVQQAMAELEKEQESEGKGHAFLRVRPLLDIHGQNTANQEQIAIELGMTHGALRSMLSRLRQRFRAIIRDLVRDTLQTPTEAEIDHELSLLRRSLEH